MTDIGLIALLVVAVVLFHRSPIPYKRLRALLRELRKTR